MHGKTAAFVETGTSFLLFRRCEHGISKADLVSTECSGAAGLKVEMSGLDETLSPKP